jgi:hypothetical protein
MGRLESTLRRGRWARCGAIVLRLPNLRQELTELAQFVCPILASTLVRYFCGSML